MGAGHAHAGKVCCPLADCGPVKWPGAASWRGRDVAPGTSPAIANARSSTKRIPRRDSRPPAFTRPAFTKSGASGASVSFASRSATSCRTTARTSVRRKIVRSRPFPVVLPRRRRGRGRPGSPGAARPFGAHARETARATPDRARQAASSRQAPGLRKAARPAQPLRRDHADRAARRR